jgi:deoxycytidylate deaminase
VVTASKHKMVGGDPDPVGSAEVVLAVVSPIATDTDTVCRVLGEALRQRAGYDPVEIRISSLIDEVASVAEPEEASSNRFRRLMDKGDTLRRESDDGSICAMLAVQAIRASRVDRGGRAMILISLKHPDEVRLLRWVYGRRFLVIGVSEEVPDREEHLRRMLLTGRRSAADQEWAAGEARALILRDEKDELQPVFGQRVRDAYQLCDVYLPVSGPELTHRAERLVDLLFGDPFITPSRDEMGISHAYAAKFRSSAGGRQVGAALLDDQGELLATGCNDVPAPGGGQSWEDEPDDHRDFAELHQDANEGKKFELTVELLGALKDSLWLAPDRAELSLDELARLALDPKEQPEGGIAPLEGTRVADLLEFGRIMHAEMAVLMTAARRGTPVRGSTLYTTTYPCHECMRLIIGAGVARVVYIDPYPKSLVSELFKGHLRVTSNARQALVLDRFVGIAPRLMPDLFSQVKQRETDLNGDYRWLTRKPPVRYVGVDDCDVGTSTIRELLVGSRLASYLPPSSGGNAATSRGSQRRRRLTVTSAATRVLKTDDTEDSGLPEGWLEEEVAQCSRSLEEIPAWLRELCSQPGAGPTQMRPNSPKSRNSQSEG